MIGVTIEGISLSNIFLNHLPPRGRMNIPSHIAYPYIIANIVALIFGAPLTFEQNILLILFCLLPDFDYVISWLHKKFTGMRFHAGVNHHEWASHWPISYIPLALLFIIMPNTYTLLMLFGILSHLALDSFACAWGVMWLYPFSTRWFNYQAARFKDITDGVEWLRVWSKTNYFRVELVALSLTAVHLFIFVYPNIPA